MAKPLDPKAIEAERQTSSRAERREQKRRQMQDEISYNQRGNGVIIPPQKRRELAEEPSKLRVAAYCRVSTQEEQQVGSFDIILLIIAALQVQNLSVIVGIIEVQGIHLTLQAAFRSKGLL